MLLTQTDLDRLASYTTLPTLSPEQANDIHQCIHANSWIASGSIRWWFPVKDTGYPTPEAVRYTQPIRKTRVLPPKTVRQPNPASIESQQPWVALNISRTTYYQRKARTTFLAPYLTTLPAWVSEGEGLKLYSLLASFSHTHNLDIKGLWVQVCKVLQEQHTHSQ